MDSEFSQFSMPKNILQSICTASGSSSPEEALQCLIDIAKSPDGRSDLASKNILTTVLELCHILSYPSHFLLLSLKLLRNLCAGEIRNQNSFIEQGGVGILSAIFSSIRLASDSHIGIIRVGLQVLGNVSLAGEEHQRAIWLHLFPLEFAKIAALRSQETCDPLCMVIYTCCEGTHELISELCGDQGLSIVAEVVHNASTVGFGEDWLKLLLSKVCLEESQFSPLFSKVSPINAFEKCGDIISGADCFVPEQAFLLNILSEILNERISDITVSDDFAVCVLEIFKSAVSVIDSASREKSGLPTGSAGINVLGYSLTILRDVCASDSLGGFREGTDVVDSLLSLGLLDLLLSLIRDLEPPAIIRKAMKQGENQGQNSSTKLCPYRGFRRDLVSVIGNCVYRRKSIQDDLRQKNAILLLLQQCVTDEDNPFLREWGIWSVRNLLEGNAENQQAVSELEVQGSVDVPEIAGLGLRVEVDPKTHHAKLYLILLSLIQLARKLERKEWLNGNDKLRVEFGLCKVNFVIGFSGLWTVEANVGDTFLDADMADLWKLSDNYIE